MAGRLKQLRHFARPEGCRLDPIWRHRRRPIRSETFRRNVLNALNGISLRVRSGRFWGGNRAGCQIPAWWRCTTILF